MHHAPPPAFAIPRSPERWRFRFNVDAFNAFNIQGMVNPDTPTGIQQLQQSYWTPRQIQFTGRLTF